MAVLMQLNPSFYLNLKTNFQASDHSACLAQIPTGIGLLGKPPAVKQFPPTNANRRTRLLRNPRGNAGMKRTSVVEHNLYFLRARDRGINKRSKPKGSR
jgi:hypothetical protein